MQVITTGGEQQGKGGMEGGEEGERVGCGSGGGAGVVWSQGQLCVNRLNGRKWQSFKVRGIFNEFAQKLIFHCNLLFICSWRLVPGRVRVSPQRTLSRPPTPSNNTPKPRENGILAKANIVLSRLKGRKSCLF